MKADDWSEEDIRKMYIISMIEAIAILIAAVVIMVGG